MVQKNKTIVDAANSNAGLYQPFGILIPSVSIQQKWRLFLCAYQQINTTFCLVAASQPSVACVKQAFIFCHKVSLENWQIHVNLRTL